MLEEIISWGSACACVCSSDSGVGWVMGMKLECDSPFVSLFCHSFFSFFFIGFLMGDYRGIRGLLRGEGGRKGAVSLCQC